MYYFLYETVNLVNGKNYIGVHSTKNLDDGYLGSGKLLKKSIDKYGIDNFKRTILKTFNSKDEMYIAESEYVTESLVENPNSYNLKVGGEGGWDYINFKRLYDTPTINLKRSNSLKLAHANGKYSYKHCNTCGFKDKKHTEYSKKLISLNNGWKLDDSVIEERLNNIKDFPISVRGNITKLSKMWKVSHTHVRRFCKKFSGV